MNFFRQIGLAFHERKIQIAVMTNQWSAEAKRREQVAPERRLRVAVPMHPMPVFHILHEAEFHRRGRLRRVEQLGGKQTKGVVASRPGRRRNCSGRRVGNVQRRAHIVKKIQH